MEILNLFAKTNKPRRISHWAWGFLVISTVCLFLALALANLRFGLVAPAGTPSDIVQRLNFAVVGRYVAKF